MKHFTFSFLLAVLLSMAGVNSFAQSFVVDGIKYNVTSENTVEVTSNSPRYSGDIVIPESVTYGGTTYTVTSIGEKAFQYCFDLTSVTIPNSVTSIEKMAFLLCDGLTSITIPNSVTNIESQAFFGCIRLTSITIPNSVTSIKGTTFSHCRGLTSVTIPNSMTTIGSGAFSDCSGLVSIAVESGNSNYDSRGNCNAIIETSSNTLIAGCKNTIIPNDVKLIGRDAFRGCSGLTSITIPNSVTSFGKYAFSYTGLTSVTISNSVTSIGSSAFSGCEGLTHITSLAIVPPNCGFWAFSGVDTSTCQLSVPEGSVEAYKMADEWKDFYNIEEIPTGIESVTKNASTKVIDSIYDLNGRQQQGLQRGSYIVRMSDGTVRKVMVK